MAENAGYGFDKMIEGWKTYSTKLIEFLADLDTSTTVFHLPSKASDQAILAFCKKPRSAQEIMKFVKMKHKTYFRQHILNPLIKKEVIELTIPSKPNSPNQKYITSIGS